MKTKTYIVLILAILVLGTVFLLKRPEKAVEVSYTLPDWQLPIDTSRVVKIGIQKGTGSVTIERKHGAWRHEHGSRLTADSALVTRLLKGVADFRLLGLVSSNPRKQDLFDVGESGTTITVATDDGKEMSLVVGRMTSLPSRSYIRPTTSDMVYLARGLTPEVIEGEAFGGLRTSTFRIDSSSILMISVEMGPTAIAVHRQGRNWISVETPIPGPQMSPVLACLQQIRAEQVGGWNLRSGEKPLLSVDVLERKRVKLEFYSGGASDSSYILQSSFSPDPYAVDIKMAQPLLKLVSFVLSRQAIASQQQTQAAPNQAPHPPPSTPKKEVAARPGTIPKQPAVVDQRRTPPKKTGETQVTRSIEDDGVLSVHIVKQGETLESIAEKYDVTRDQLMQWNLLTSETVRPGAELYVFVRRK